jgi:cutinase
MGVSSLLKKSDVVKRSAGIAGAAVLGATLMIVGPRVVSMPLASAAPPCPGAEVVFARGREEPPGVGLVGDAFVNSLRAKTPMPVGVYGVNYPADVDPAKGSNDMSTHVQWMAKHCPNTREVLGGYSLVALSADLVVAVTQPSFGFKNPLPPGMDQHIAAVALFGNGTQRVLGPVPSFSPAFAGKTIEQCAPGDPICSGTGKAVWASHLQPSYIDSGLVDQAAAFAAGKL